MNDDQTNPQVPETPTLSVADAPSEMLEKKPAAGQSIKVPVIIGGVLVVVAVAAGSLVLLSQNTATTDTNQPAIDQPVILSEFASFKDGTYYTEVSYYVEPLDKDEIIGVTLVIENGAIKSATAVSIEDGEEVASSYMDEFNDGVAGKVVATNFGNIYASDLVAGSTLTSNAFKEALKSIEQEAGRKDSVGTYADGTYTARIKYYVAAKADYDDMIVDVTIADGQITEVTTYKVKDGEPTADSHTEEFDMAVMELIAGKDLDTVYTMDLVSGSTLTSNAFQKSLEMLTVTSTTTESAS